MTVAVHDRHEVFRAGIADALSAAGLDVHAGMESLERSGLVPPADALVISLRSRADVERLRDVRRTWPDLPIVSLLDDHDALSYARARDAGATAVVPHDADGDCVSAAVGAALAGLVTVPAEVADAWSEPFLDRRTALVPPDELAWLRALAAGRSMRSVAARARVPRSVMERRLQLRAHHLGLRTVEALLAEVERRGLLAPVPH